ncbi:MAG: hypothetical protein GC154_02375 [bacterium]|nr:hypothetical protein [bacterium]
MVRKLRWSTCACLSLLTILFASLPVFSETEPNNTVATASVISLPGDDAGSLSSQSPFDWIDVFQVSLPQNGYFSFGVVPDPAVDLRVELLDSNGYSVLASKNDGGAGTTEGIVYSNLRAGQYYCAIYLISGSGTYTAKARFSESESVDAEPNDAPSQADTIAANGSTVGNVGFHGQLHTDVDDYFTVSVPDDGELEVTVFPDDTLDAYLALFDSTGTDSIASVNAKGKGQSEKIVYSNLAAGTYFIRVYVIDGYGAYSLTSQHRPCQTASDIEPNNRQTSSVPLTVSKSSPATVNGRLGYFGSQFQDDRDFYSITTNEFGALTLDYAATAAGNNVDLACSVFDAQYRYLAGTGENKITLNLPAGKYYVELYRQDRFGGYTLTASLANADPVVPYSGPAASYTLGQQVSGVILNNDSKTAYYKFNVPEDGSISFTVQGVAALWFEANIYNSDGVSRLKNGGLYFKDESVTIEIPNILAGDYVFMLSHFSGEGALSFTSTHQSALYHDAESNDIWSETAPLPGVDQIIHGHLGYSGNGWTDVMDYYRINLPRDGALRVDFTGEAPLWFDVALVDQQASQWKQLQKTGLYFKDPSVSASFTQPNMKAGSYLLYVSRNSGYGNYELNVDYTVIDNTDAEPNDFQFNANQLLKNDMVTGHLGFTSGYRLDTGDVYFIDLQEEGSLTLYAQSENTLWFDIYLYEDDARTKVINTGVYFKFDPVTMTAADLKPGRYYLLVNRNSGYGCYHLGASFTANAYPDVPQNDMTSVASALNLGQIAQGSLGFNNRLAFDSYDWYRLSVPTEASYRVSYQIESTLWADVAIYNAQTMQRLFNDGIYFRSTVLQKDVTLPVGDYYVYCVRNSGYGDYTLRIGSADGSATGSLSGIVYDKKNLEIFEVNVGVFGQSTQTDFAGEYLFDALPPGHYPISFSKGSKYYPITRTVEIKPGEKTSLNVVLEETNSTAPADVENFKGIVGLHYIHLFWTPSISPDVSDGGGYNLYVNGEKQQLGNVFYYRSDQVTPGVALTLRLTVYDKFGNESAGKTITLTPYGDGDIPTPTPTPVPGSPTLTPSPTLPPQAPTPTPTVAVSTPIPTPTVPVIVSTPTPQPPAKLEPAMVYEFDKTDLASCGWGEIKQNPPGQVQLINFMDAFIPKTLDKKGLAITVNPYNFAAGEKFEYAFLFGAPAIKTQGKHVLLRMTCRANQKDVQIYLAGMKADFQTFDIEGSLVVTNPATAVDYSQHPQRVIALFPADPPKLNIQTGSMETPQISITPIIQIAASAVATEPATVWVDKLEVFLLDPAEAYTADVFNLAIE